MGSFIALYLPHILYHSVHIGSAIEMAPEEYIFFQGGPPCKWLSHIEYSTLCHLVDLVFVSFQPNAPNIGDIGFINSLFSQGWFNLI